MTEQDLVNTARSVVDAFNDNDWDRLASLLTPDSVYSEVATQRRLEGVAEIVRGVQSWKEAMPDAKGTVTNAFANTDKAALEVTWEGTHTGPLAGPAGTIPPSGKRHATPSAWVFYFDGDKIKESHNYFDMLAMLQQIGAVPH
jgi:steroid delta-isomerase-like uncharacterized protein